MMLEQKQWYTGPMEIPINGLYRVHTQGNCKFGQFTCMSGFYSGEAEFMLRVPKGSMVMFDRYPQPQPERPEHCPLPDPVSDVTLEQRLREYVAEMRSDLGLEQSRQPERIADLELDQDGYPDLYQVDQVNLGEEFLDELGDLLPEDREYFISPESDKRRAGEASRESLSENDPNPRVGGGAIAPGGADVSDSEPEKGEVAASGSESA